VGKVSAEIQRLLGVTRDVLHLAIQRMGQRRWWSEVAEEMQAFVRKAGFSVVEDFVGHGIGRTMHEDPQVPNFGPAGKGPRLKAGMVLAIEPMINAGGPEVRVLKDGWTAITVDGSYSAHFEHTVAITNDGPLVLTV
jgi:methionyl aminopeptidase